MVLYGKLRIRRPARTDHSQFLHGTQRVGCALRDQREQHSTRSVPYGTLRTQTQHNGNSVKVVLVIRQLA